VQSRGLEFQTQQHYRKATAYYFFLVQKLKVEAELVSWQVNSKESGEPGQKRRKTFVKQDDRNKKL
jgi:hypothetical protein